MRNLSAAGAARIVLLLLWPVLAAGSCAASDADSPQTKQPATLIAADGTRSTVQVEVMRTPEQLWTGLRWRKQMPAGEGMLFDLGASRQATFTMQDTLIPLDMLFIAADGRIVNIEANTVPGNVGPYLSKGPVRAVLELNAGAAVQYHIAAGAKVRNELFHAAE